jgi:hypothetical protein
MGYPPSNYKEKDQHIEGWFSGLPPFGLKSAARRMGHPGLVTRTEKDQHLEGGLRGFPLLTQSARQKWGTRGWLLGQSKQFVSGDSGLGTQGGKEVLNRARI